MDDARVYTGASHNEIRNSTLHGGQTLNITNYSGPDNNSPPQDNYRGTELHLAAEKGDDVRVQQLLNNDCDIEATDMYGQTALHRGAGKGHRSAVLVLLNALADVNAKDNLGKTALHHAARNECVLTVRVLIDKGADAMARDNLGKTALHHAAEKGNVKAAQFLLLVPGMDRDARDCLGHTALDLAAINFSYDVKGNPIRYLIDCFDNGNCVLYFEECHTIAIGVYPQGIPWTAYYTFRRPTSDCYYFKEEDVPLIFRIFKPNMFVRASLTTYYGIFGVCFVWISGCVITGFFGGGGGIFLLGCLVGSTAPGVFGARILNYVRRPRLE